MIEAIRDIGEYVIIKNGKSIDDPLNILIEDPASKESYKTILFININESNGIFHYKDITIEEYSKLKLLKYLYKKGIGARGTDITPISRVTDIEKTFNKNILRWAWFDKNDIFLQKIGECIKNNKQIILNDLKEKHKGTEGDSIVSVKLNGKYIGDFEIFRKLLIYKSKENYYSKYNEISKSDKEEYCSVCNEKENEVYGFVSTFPFYTVDKPGFISSGFQQKDTWKNYPVCLKCALTLEEGRKYLHKSLNFNFYGFNYHLIPKLINIEDYEKKEEIFGLIEDWKDPKFKRKVLNRLTSDENEILEMMSEQQNYINFNFMFYNAPRGYDGSEFNILLYIEDILPSRLKKLFEVKKEIDRFDIFKECMIPIFKNQKKVGEKPLEFNFGILRTFFYDTENKKWISTKHFLDIVNKIFSDKSVDYNFLLKFIMERVKREFINNYPTKISILKGFMLINYLNQLNILRRFREEIKMDSNDLNVFQKESSSGLEEKIESFFSKYTDFFNDEVRKSVFLEGTLTQKLLNIQRLPEVSNAKPGNEPFRPKLKGLKLNEKLIKKLLPEIQNKLEEYGKNYYRSLESIISGYLVKAGHNWKITNDEISFYFVLGMNLSYLFKSKEKEEKENVNE